MNPLLRKSIFRNVRINLNGDTLGPEELIVWLEQGNQGDQGDQREQDDQGEISIIFGMSESSEFQKYSIFRVLQALCLYHFICLCICVLL